MGRCLECEMHKTALARIFAMSKVDIAAMEAKFERHLRAQNLERMVYAGVIEIARPIAGSLFGGKLSIIIDGAGDQQSTIPWLQSPTKGLEDGRLKMKMMGVYVHWVGVFMFCTTTAQAHGANLTIECLVHVLRGLQQQYGADKLPRCLALQLDNCSDNKCLAVLGWCAWLLELGVFDEITVNFLQRGHTHEVRLRVKAPCLGLLLHVYGVCINLPFRMQPSPPPPPRTNPAHVPTPHPPYVPRHSRACPNVRLSLSRPIRLLLSALPPQGYRPPLCAHRPGNARWAEGPRS